MLIRRGYRYKLKIDAELEAKLLLQAGHARFVWNKCLAMNLHRLDQKQCILWEQEMQFWLTRWKQSEEYGFLREADSQVLQQKLKDLARAFRDGFDKNQPNKRIPVFRKRGAGDSIRFPQRFELDYNRIKLPKLGWIRFYRSRPWEGTPKNVTVRRESDGWYLSIQTEQEIVPVSTATSLIGLDRGIRDFAATSDGKLVAALAAFQRYQDQLAFWQRKLAKKVKFSENWKKVKRKISRIHHKIACCRKDFLHKLSTRLSKKHAMVVLEQLQIRNMSKSARGTVDEPGTNVAQKQGLNRSILDQGWGLFAGMLEYKLEARGGSVLYVPAPYTSQTCPVCRHRDKANRKDKHFHCGACHYENDADIVGALNIEAAGQALLASPG